MPRARPDRIIPLEPVNRLMRKAAARRVSSDATILLAQILEAIGTQLTKEALVLANHAKRKTVTSADITTAFFLGKAPENLKSYISSTRTSREM